MQGHLRHILTACAGLALCTGGALADTMDDADVTLNTYFVEGDTLADVQADMDANGPSGFWAYTTWNVNWNGDCETTVTADVTLPRLGPGTNLSDEDVAEFDRMLAALQAHELQHVDIGLAYAADIEDKSCPDNSDAILQPYLEQERAFDVETEHGRTQGVYLSTEE